VLLPGKLRGFNQSHPRRCPLHNYPDGMPTSQQKRVCQAAQMPRYTAAAGCL